MTIQEPMNDKEKLEAQKPQTDDEKTAIDEWWDLEDEQMHLNAIQSDEPKDWNSDWQSRYWDDDGDAIPMGSGYYNSSSGMWTPGKYTPKTYTHVPETYYFAYGSNLHDPQMMRRCKDAEPVASCTLSGWRLVFRGVADIERSNNKADYVHGAIYKVSDWDEAQLDIYEGFPNLYRKEFFEATLESGEKIEVMFYKMNANDYGTPPKGYFDTISSGFVHWGLEMEKLEQAVRFTEAQKGGKVERFGRKPHGYARWIGKGSAGVLGHPASSTLVGARIEAMKNETLSVMPQPPNPTKSSQKSSTPKSEKVTLPCGFLFYVTNTGKKGKWACDKQVGHKGGHEGMPVPATPEKKGK
jgi:gamma-glutamylcyclotransferase (GGCT)/AIG2-like uncharacterized protein YtfP